MCRRACTLIFSREPSGPARGGAELPICARAPRTERLSARLTDAERHVRARASRQHNAGSCTAWSVALGLSCASRGACVPRALPRERVEVGVRDQPPALAVAGKHREPRRRARRSRLSHLLLQRSGSSGSSGLQQNTQCADLDSSGWSALLRNWASPCQGEGRGFESRRPLQELVACLRPSPSSLPARGLLD
jgi:hypothetical protein